MFIKSPINPVLIDIPMPIETERMIIRPPHTGDGAAVTEAKAESWDRLKPWMAWAKGDGPNAADDECTMRKAGAQFILREDLMMLAFEKASGKPFVFTGLHRNDWEKGLFEIGYWVRSSASGKGYVTESTNALTRFAFEALGARKVLINCAEGNGPSAAVALRLGFAREAIIRYGTTLPGGRIADQHCYARFDTHGLPELNVKW